MSITGADFQAHPTPASARRDEQAAAPHSVSSEHDGRCPGFDGMRGAGIVAVILHHQAIPALAHAYIFLDLFFVLSGFLITGLLAREYATRGRISLKAFWQRRILRITPLYVLYISILTLGCAVGAFEYPGDVGHYLKLLWLYALNLDLGITDPIAWQGWDISAFLWSLSLEEQFYLFWPFLCIFLLRGSHRARLILPAMVVVHLIAFQLSETRQGVMLPPWTRGMGMTMGSSAALLLHWYPGVAGWLRRTWVQPLCLVVIFGTVITMGFMTPEPDEYTTIKYFVPPLIFPLTTLCASLWVHRETTLHRCLSWSPLLYLGKISYGLYIWHSLAFVLAGFAVSLEPEFMYYPELAATLLLGSASYAFFERPFLRLKAKLSARTPREVESVDALPSNISGAAP
jgi:peptidoglycan/LPS O-acetylase OafA/YrhL